MLLSVTRWSGESFIAMQISVAYEWLGLTDDDDAFGVRWRAGSGGDGPPLTPQRGGGGGDRHGGLYDVGDPGSDFTLEPPLPLPPVMSRMAFGSTCTWCLSDFRCCCCIG